MRARLSKDCYCYTCGRAFNYLGIASHRASHRRRCEDCTIMFTYGDVKSWEYSKLKGEGTFDAVRTGFTQ